VIPLPSEMSPSAHGEHVLREVTAWPGVTTRPERFGGIDFVVNGRSIGHVHVYGSGGQADIPFPRRIRDRLVAESRTGPHHIHPDSGWTTRYIHARVDADEVVDLFRINYDRITSGQRDPVPDEAH
jgi:hypothetical protein